MADEVRRLLNGYIRYLKRCRQGEKEPGSNLVVREVRATYSVTEPTLVNSLPRSPANSLPHSPVDTVEGDDQ